MSKFIIFCFNNKNTIPEILSKNQVPSELVNKIQRKFTVQTLQNYIKNVKNYEIGDEDRIFWINVKCTDINLNSQDVILGFIKYINPNGVFVTTRNITWDNECNDSVYNRARDLAKIIDNDFTGYGIVNTPQVIFEKISPNQDKILILSSLNIIEKYNL